MINKIIFLIVICFSIVLPIEIGFIFATNPRLTPKGEAGAKTKIDKITRDTITIEMSGKADEWIREQVSNVMVLPEEKYKGSCLDGVGFHGWITLNKKQYFFLCKNFAEAYYYSETEVIKLELNSDFHLWMSIIRENLMETIR
jgi:hypothetical protein